MRTDTASKARVEAAVLHFFSPSGLITALILILLSLLLFSGIGIEQRMVDRSEIDLTQITSPLLAQR